ncbi:MAG: cytochrome c [Pseudomonadota bacterium]|nr:cytochrome c [Pseudomonadota bacterium]
MHSFQRLFLGVAAAMLVLTGVAHADVIADRKAIMKMKMGASMGVLAKTMKGEMDYDPAAVLAAFTTMREGIEGFGELFPEDSMSGGETIASPKIWEDMEGFQAAITKVKSDLDTAIAAAPQDKAAFTPVFQSVAGNCGACHETYRIKQ